MAYATDIRTGARAEGFRARVAQLFSDLAERRARARIYRTTLSELQALSDRDLLDLGVSPGNLRSTAYEAAYGSK